MADVIERKLSDGSVVKAENLEQAFDVAVKMKEDTSAALRETKRQLEEYQQQTAQEQQRLQAELQQLRQQSQPPNPNRYDSERFYKNLNDAPPDAVVDALAYKLGTTPDELVRGYKSMSRDVEEIKHKMLGTEFLQRHAQDFNPKDANLLGDKFAEMVREGQPQNMRTLEGAYIELLQEGKVKPLEQKANKKEEETPNPSLKGDSSDTGLSADEEAKLMSMPLDELERVMKEKGVLR